MAGSGFENTVRRDGLWNLAPADSN